jgi:hypothetical protein
MIRVSCSCGKILHLKDEMAGKRVACPKCQTILLVAEQSKSTIGVDSQTESVEELSQSRSSARRPARIDHDGTKVGGGRLKTWALLGLAALCFVACLGTVGGAAWWFFLREQSNSGKPEEAKGPAIPESGPGSKQEPAIIKLHVPAKVGDVRDITIKREESENVQRYQDGKPVGINSPSQMKIAFRGRVKTLAVNEQGGPAKTEIEIAALTENGIRVMRPGMMLGAEQQGEQLVHYRHDGYPLGVESRVLQKLFGNRADTSGQDIEAAFGTSERKVVGDSWPINKEVFAKVMAKRESYRLEPSNVSGTVSLAGATKEGAVTYLEVKVVVAIALNDVEVRNKGGVHFLKGTFQLAMTLWMPHDYSTGPVKTTTQTESKVQVSANPRGGGGASANVSQSSTEATETKYYSAAQGQRPGDLLDFEDKPVRTKTSIQIAQAHIKIKMRLTHFTVQYTFKEGNPLPDAEYRLCVRFSAPKEKPKDRLIVHVCKGNELQQSGEVAFALQDCASPGWPEFELWFEEWTPRGLDREVSSKYAGKLD